MRDDRDLLSRYEERSRQVRTYERTWWAARTGAHLAHLRAHPEVRARLLKLAMADQRVETAQIYADDKLGTWADERVDLHERILTTLSHEDGEFVHDMSRQSADTAVYFLLGLPGSGKSSSLRPVAEAHSQSIGRLPSSDADAVRVLLPEYADGRGSGVVQTETVVVTYGIGYRAGDGRQNRVLSQGRDAVVDVIGDPQHLPAAVQVLAKQGRSVYLLLASCPPETCKARVMNRALSNGRYVPTALVDAKVGVPEAALGAAVSTNLVDGWAIIDTQSDSVAIVDSDGTFDDVLAKLDGDRATRR